MPLEQSREKVEGCIGVADRIKHIVVTTYKTKRELEDHFRWQGAASGFKDSVRPHHRSPAVS